MLTYPIYAAAIAVERHIRGIDNVEEAVAVARQPGTDGDDARVAQSNPRV